MSMLKTKDSWLVNELHCLKTIMTFSMSYTMDMPAQRQAEVRGTRYACAARLIPLILLLLYQTLTVYYQSILSSQSLVLAGKLIDVTCIAEHAPAATYTNAYALAKPQASRARCRALQESESGGY